MTAPTPSPPPVPPAAANERALLLSAALAALAFLRCAGTADLKTFWLPATADGLANGLVAAYRAHPADYPPLAHAILWLAGRLGGMCGAGLFLSVKACLLGFGGVSVALFRRCWPGLAPLAFFVGVAGLDSVLLGYLDTLYAPTLLLGLWALRRRRTGLFSALFAVTCLIDWHPLLVLPFCAWYAWRPGAADGGGARAVPALRRVAALVVPGSVVAAAVFFVFGGGAVGRAFRASLGSPYISGTALNLDWALTYLLQRWQPHFFGALADGQASAAPVGKLHLWAWLLRAAFACLYGLSLWRFGRGERSFADLLRASLLGCLAYCLFQPGVHENYYFLAAVLACALAAVDPAETGRAAAVAAMTALGMVTFHGFDGTGLVFSRVAGVDLSFPFSLFFTALFLWWWTHWWWAVPRPKGLDFPGGR